jgi:hypothetical protein
MTSYGSTVTDGRGGYQSTDPFAGMANGNYTNFSEQTKSISRTVENPTFRNYH